MVWHPNVVLYNTLDESLGDSDDANVKIRKFIIMFQKSLLKLQQRIV